MNLSKKITVDRKLMKWHLDIGWKKMLPRSKKFHYPLRIIYIKKFNLLIMHDIDILAFDSQHRVCLFTFNVILFRNPVWALFNLKSNYAKFIKIKYLKIALCVKICIKKKSNSVYHMIPSKEVKLIWALKIKKEKNPILFHLCLCKRILLHEHAKIIVGQFLNNKINYTWPLPEVNL